MTTCAHCGVIVEAADSCPLCGNPLPQNLARDKAGPTGEPRDSQSMSTAARSGAAPVVQRAADFAPPREETVRSAKWWLFEMTSLVAFTVAIVLFAADFAFGFSITWSVYPLVSIGFVWLAVTGTIPLVRRRVLLIGYETAIVAGFLLAISAFSGGTDWFVGLALPITVLLGVVAVAETVIVATVRLARLVVAGTVVLAAGVFVVGLELIITAYVEQSAPVSWSLVALACTISIFFLTIFINKRLRDQNAEFRRIFHI
ncbi:MAG: hypothetical protein EA382_18740 [Spirochaetaceae bacterium]|nr:MAG: hypothetical protein EA382_18740 [Spirochaetaceae bacterium]